MNTAHFKTLNDSSRSLLSSNGETFSHLLGYPIPGNPSQTLVIDSFNDVMETMDTVTFERLKTDPSKLAPSVANSCLNTFAWSAARLEAARSEQEKINKERKKCRPITYNICPTFDCNMRCSYCYQQHDKSLDRNHMSEEKLTLLLEILRERIAQHRKGNPGQTIEIGLFGGEPFIPANKPTIKKIFDFARQERALLTATTNGSELGAFIDLLAIYRGYIARIGTTLDGGPEFHNRRRITLRKGGSHDKIVANVNTLLSLGIHTSVQMNLDPTNIGELPAFFTTAKTNNWTENRLVQLEIGRVDDRNYDSKYRHYFMESELLAKLLAYHRESPFPGNVKFAFLKTSQRIAKRLGLDFAQGDTNRAFGSYCWSTSPLDEVHYIDPDLNTYRCTYTVGKPQFTTGSIRREQKIEVSYWLNHTLFGRTDCQSCPIGGYCGSGCRLSSLKNQERQCNEEKENFQYLIKHILLPMFKNKTTESLCVQY